MKKQPAFFILFYFLGEEEPTGGMECNAFQCSPQQKQKTNKKKTSALKKEGFAWDVCYFSLLWDTLHFY